MGKRIFIIVIFVYIILQSYIYGENTLAILPFEDAIGTYGKGSGKIASEIMITVLSEDKIFTLVERADIGKIMKEQGLSLTGAINTDSAIKVGTLLGAKYLMIGKVTQVEKLSGIDTRYKKCCVLLGCLTFGCLGAIAAAIFPAKGYRVGLNVRIVNAETGKIIFTASEIDKDDTIHEAIEDCVESIVKKISKKFKQ